MAKRRHALINKASSSAEVNDLTAAVTWANIPDANVPQSAVTQHEAALTIIEGQITGAAFTNWNSAYGWGDHSTQNYAVTTGDTFTGNVTIDTDGAGPMLSIGDPSGADGDVLLKFNIDRGWQFKQGSSGAGTNLQLQSLVASKLFYISDNLGVQRFSFNPTSGDLTIAGNINANGNIVGDGATTVSGVETLTMDQTGDITKSGEGNYLYHKSSSYNNDQNGGITFGTGAASGGTTGDIHFQYTA